MKTRYIALCLMVIAATAVSSRGTSPPARYQFEPESRALLTHSGIKSSRDPKLALKASGAVYMLAVIEQDGHSRLGLFVSHDGGDEFSPPIPVSERDADVVTHGENSPSLAFGATEIYALWEQRAATGIDLMFARSVNFGNSFEKPIRVTDKTVPSSNSFSHLAVAPNGFIYAVWLDGRDRGVGPEGTSAVYLARSTDRGATFEKNTMVAPGACPCCRPVVAPGRDGEIFVSWRHVFEGNIRDMVVVTSRDHGKAFLTPVRVAQDNWQINGCPHSGMTMVQKSGRLIVSWFSEGSEGRQGIRVSWSTDGGNSFAPARIVSGRILDANHPSLTLSDDGRVLLAFQGRDPVAAAGWSPAGVYLAEVGAGGEVSTPMPVSKTTRGVSYPVLAGGGSGRVFVAWTESGDTGRRVMLSRGRKINATVTSTTPTK